MLAAVAVLLLAVLPTALLVHQASSDPVFGALDQLDLPSWAAQNHVDTTSGSRWCVDSCQLRERTLRSAKAAKDTDPVYQAALSGAGWTRADGAGCRSADNSSGILTCWQHDQYLLALFTRDAVCALSDVAPAPGTPAPSASGDTGDGGAGPAGDPATAIPTPGATGPPPVCGGSLVTIKVADRGDPPQP